MQRLCFSSSAPTDGAGFGARALLALFSACALLAGCATGPAIPGGKPPPSSNRPGARPGPGRVPVRPPVRTPPRDPRLQNTPGLEGVIGVTAAELVRQFGKPRLEVWEGDARKLQFAGTACLIDVYLYPTSATREPVATWVDARRASDGLDVDRAACVAALRQR